MNTEPQSLRLEMDGSWECPDLGRMCLHIEDIYNLRLVLQFMLEDVKEWQDELRENPDFFFLRRKMARALRIGAYSPITEAIPLSTLLDPLQLRRLAAILGSSGPLRIRRIEYASPGFTDLTGVGQIVGHLKDFLVQLIEICRPSSREQRQLENRQREVDIRQREISNAREVVALAKDIGLSETEIQRMVLWMDDRQETFIQLINEGKLTGVRLIEHDDGDDHKSARKFR